MIPGGRQVPALKGDARMGGKRAERLQVMLTIDEVRKVEEWRFEHRMPSRSAAVRALMNLGLHVKAPQVNESAMLEGAVSSRDAGVVENGSFLTGSETAADGPAVLVMAGDYLVGQGIRRLLDEAGFRVVGPAAGPGEARSLAKSAAPAAAVIDAAAHDGSAAATADYLAERGVPFLFLIADGPETSLPEQHRSAPVASREQAASDLAACVSGLLRLDERPRTQPA